MPITVFNEAANAQQPILLKREMAEADVNFGVPEGQKYGIQPWQAALRPNFTCQVPDINDDARRELAEFLNSNTEGPFYVGKGNGYYTEFLHLTFLKQTDVDKFARKYPDNYWKFSAGAYAGNQETLGLWHRCRRPFADSVVQKYATRELV